MPLISPEIQKILRDAGLTGDQKEDATSSSNPVAKALDEAGLGIKESAEALSYIAQNSTSDIMRIRAIETGLKARGALKENPVNNAPTFIINIDKSDFAKPSTVDLEKTQGVNPILLPRQMLKDLPN